MYKLVLKVETEPMKIRGFKLKSYIVGRGFKVVFSLTNEGDETFLGGNMTIQILWANRQFYEPNYRIPEIKPGETKQAIYNNSNEPFSILAVPTSGYGFFYLQKTSSIDNKPLIIYESPDSDHGIGRKNVFYTILCKDPEELYQYWAMIFAIASLLIIVMEKVFHLIQLIISIFN